MARRLWGLLVVLLVLSSLGASAYMYQLLRREQAARAALAAELAAVGPKLDQRVEQFKTAVREVNKQLSSTVFQEIDLEATGWQPISGGFYLIDLAVGAGGGGQSTKITGKIINPTSVTHEQAQFLVRLRDKRANFSLPKVPPAVAQPFEVAFPEVPAAEAHRAFIALEGSTISFSSSTTRRRSAAEPVDTDKLLR